MDNLEKLNINKQKNELRLYKREMRKIYTQDRVQYNCDAESLKHQLQQSALINSDKLVSGYWPLADEIDPRPWMRLFDAMGGRIALPRVLKDKELTFNLWDFEQPLTLSSLGVMEPEDSTVSVCPDIILTPLLACDRHGHRLGYGHGHFDRALAALRLRPQSLITIGLAFDEQIVDHVPHNDHDQSLDYVITPTTFYRF